jgi:glycerophosphoryl diester phosphodiesterase
VLRLAHRGDHSRAPENSLAAFAAALVRPGCDGLEFDLRGSLDGVAVVLHDATLARVQGRPERADELSAAALGTLGVPTLAHVLAACGPEPFLDVELKEDLGSVALGPLVAARGLADGSLSRVGVSSSEPATIATVRRLAPAITCWLNADHLDLATLDAALALGCRGISVEWRALNEQGAAAVAAIGLDLAAFTPTRRATLERLARLGVVAACQEGAALGAGLRPAASRSATGLRTPLAAEQVGWDEPTQRRRAGRQRPLDVKERERPLSHPEGGRSRELDQQVAEIRIVTNQDGPDGPGRIVEDRVERWEVSDARQARFDRDGHPEVIGHELGRLAGADAGRREHGVRREPGRGEEPAQPVGLLATPVRQRPQLVRPIPGGGISRVRVAKKPQLHRQASPRVPTGSRPRARAAKGSTRAAISPRTRRKTASRSSSVPWAAAGSSNPQ